MKEYMDKIIEEFPYLEKLKNMKSVKNSAAQYLFTVNHNATNLDAEKSDVFHTKISKALFI